MNKNFEMIVKSLCSVLLIVFAGISILYVLDIFGGEKAREYAAKLIKVISILIATSFMMLVVGRIGKQNDQ